MRRLGQDHLDRGLPANNFNNFPGVPLINGSNTNFSHPFVLTYPANANPTDKPRPQLTVTNLTGFTQGKFPVISSVISGQLWLRDLRCPPLGSPEVHPELPRGAGPLAGVGATVMLT